MYTFPPDSATTITTILFTKTLNLIILNYQTLWLNNIVYRYLNQICLKGKEKVNWSVENWKRNSRLNGEKKKENFTLFKNQICYWEWPCLFPPLVCTLYCTFSKTLKGGGGGLAAPCTAVEEQGYIFVWRFLFCNNIVYIFQILQFPLS